MKMKRSKKKNKGLELRIKREEFLQELKTPAPKIDTGQDILNKIRNRGRRKTKLTPKPSPYNAGHGGPMYKALRKMAGFK